MQRRKYKAWHSFFFPNILLPRFSENPTKRMHFDLQFKTRLDHVSLKMESIILLHAQICVLQCLQNMQSLGSFPAQTSMPLFGSLLCARFRAQETAECRSTVTYGVTCWALSQNKTSCSILPGSIITDM